MVLNDDEEHHWEFPKGKQEVGETDCETALRELEEETGLSGKIVSGEPLEFDFNCVVKGNQYHKTVKYFYCRVSDKAEVVLQEEELGKFEWLPLTELENRATYPKMKDAAKKACIHLSNC